MAFGSEATKRWLSRLSFDDGGAVERPSEASEKYWCERRGGCKMERYKRTASKRVGYGGEDGDGDG